jgi:hypothetical protein
VLATKDFKEVMPEFTERHALRALTALKDEGLATSLRRYDLNIEGGKASHFWGLTKKGVRMAEWDAIATESTKTIDEHSANMMEHEVLISRIHIRLVKVFSPRLRWFQRDLKHLVNADAYFDIDGIHRFFIEPERSKLSDYDPKGRRRKDGGKMPSILSKLLNYHDNYDTDRFEKDWGFRKFRVITVLQPKRFHERNLMAQLTEECPHRMFWLTTIPEMLDNPTGRIFKTPKGDSYSFADL